MRVTAWTRAYAFTASVDDDTWMEHLHKSSISHAGEHLQLRLAENPLVGFGFQVWTGALVLSCFLEQYLVCHGRRVLELGAGCGLVGILVAHLGGEVTLTDVDEVLPITHHNVGLNARRQGEAGTLCVKALRWGMDIRDVFHRGQFDIILGSDLTYSDHLHGPLLVTLLQLVNEETTVILACTRREHDAFNNWRRRFQRYLDVKLLVTEEETAAYSSLGVVNKSGNPISIFQLQYIGPPPFEEDLTSLFQDLDTENPDDLLARLALRTCELDTIHVDEHKV